MKNMIFITTVFVATLICHSCCKDKPTLTPVPEKKTEYTLRFVSSEIVEFRDIVLDKNIRDIPKDKVKDYFGERIEFAIPTELQFKNDSLLMVKPQGIVEKYKIRWKDNELYLHNKLTDTWQYCGKKNGNNVFVLNTGFYSLTSNTHKRALKVIGQSYALKSYADLDAVANSSTVWMQMHTSFEQK